MGAMEDRIARIEGILEQMDKRLNHLEESSRRVVHLIIAMWVTITGIIVAMWGTILVRLF